VVDTGGPRCHCLKQRGIPFVFHTGYTPIPQACGSEIVITKPASREQLVAAIQGLCGLPRDPNEA
jgi:hypothetical protein